ncbi:MAG: COG3014 family protein [Bdellovibrionia bacterium]
MRALSALAVFALAWGALTGCSSARMSDHESDSLFRQGQYEAAATRLQKGLDEHGTDSRDSLLYLLDIGLAYNTAGKYEESIKAFLKADKIAEIKDYTSLATESATVLTSDNIKDYKGEDFEKVLINAYLALDYAMLGNTEDALVEARRVNHKLHLMKTDGKRNYEYSAFARYMSGILYEAEGDANNAYIDYKEVYRIQPGFPEIGKDLWRTAWLSHMSDAMDEWDEAFHLSKADHEAAKKSAPRSGLGEIIVVYQNGISPIKRPHPNFSSIPKFYPRHNPVMSADIEIASAQVAPSQFAQVDWKKVGTSAMLDNIEKASIEALDEKYAGIVARKLAGVVAKEAVGYAVAEKTNSPLLGFLTKVALYASDQADLRSWNLLPHDLQVLRIPVEPGTYRVRALPGGGAPTPDKTIQVLAGKKVFVTFRYMP